VSQLRRIVGF